MTNTNETIADIIAEMRKISAEKHRLSSENGGAYGNPGVYYLDFAQFARVISDRLEAAWKREKATTENSSAVGDAAKMREALIKAQIALKVCDWTEGTDMDGVAKIMREIDAALAAPPRNCDMFGTDNAEASLAYEEFCDRAEVEKSVNGAIAWLLSPDADKEGGNDGR